MSKKFLKNIQNLKNLSIIVKDANKPAFNDIVEKYKNGTIKRFDTSINLVMKLSKARGTGQIKAKQTIANIDKPKSKQISKPKQTKSKLDVGIDDDEGVISKSVKSKKAPETKPPKTFHITANLVCNVQFISKVNNNTYNHTVPYNNISKTIQAGSIDEAKELFVNECMNDFLPKYSRGKTTMKTIEYTSIVDQSEMSATPTEDMMMKRAQAVKYTFFPEVFDKFEKNDGYCVFNTFVATYSQYIKKLTQERFIEMCYQVRGEQITNINSLNSLDKDIDDDEPKMIKNTWSKDDGVSPKMLFDICQILHISHYAYDATNKCFLKYVSENNHSYPALVYYAVNDHMYHIKDANAVKKLVSKTLKTEYKIKSSVFADAEDEKVNIYTKYPIKENIPIEALEKESEKIEKDSGLVIYYTETDDLEAEFEQIIYLYKTIPIIRNKRAKIIGRNRKL